MKKILVVCAAAMLCCSLANAQEAEDSGRGAGLSVIPRLDLGGLLYTGDGSFCPTLGNTSLYTLFEGNISDNWSFSAANHWVASDACWADGIDEALLSPTAGLYHLNLNGGNMNNFIDWAYISYTPGDFEITVGKQVLLLGGFESEDYDFDVNPLLASSFWNGFPCYQLGATVAYDIPNINTRVALQHANGPLGNTFAFGVNGSYGPFSIKYTALGYKGIDTADPAQILICLGNRLELESLTLTLDYFNRCGDPNFVAQDDYTYAYPTVHGNTLICSMVYDKGGKWDLGLKTAVNAVNPKAPYGYVNANKDNGPRYPGSYYDGTVYTLTNDTVLNQGTVNAGAWFSWYPKEERESLRLQAAAGVNGFNYADGAGSLFLTIGATWNFNFNLW
jgi:hypothetical protein